MKHKFVLRESDSGAHDDGRQTSILAILQNGLLFTDEHGVSAIRP